MPTENPLASAMSFAGRGECQVFENKKELMFFIVMGGLVVVAGIAVVTRFI